MFVESSLWIRDALQGLALREGATALDVGSSTLEYRTVEQPHVERNVIAPLRERGVEITHLDAKEAPGVDIVCDIDTAGPELSSELGQFDLVLCAGLLSCAANPVNAVQVVQELVRPNGWLVVSTPEAYRRTLDPRDNMLRPSPDELTAMFRSKGPPSFETVRTGSVRIDERRYYRGLKSRASGVPLFRRVWLPLPGFTETLRYPIKSLRWRESCALLRRNG